MFRRSWTARIGHPVQMISSPTPLSVFDAYALTTLKSGLRKDDPQALKAAAQQFEALFLQMVLKSMRAATPQDGPFDSDQTRFYQELLDAQLAQTLATRGGMGLAKVIEKQWAREVRPDEPADVSGLPLTAPSQGFPFLRERGLSLPDPQKEALPLSLENAPQQPAASAAKSAASSAQSFVANVWPHAVAASRMTGIPAHFIVAHAALESGWGRAEPKTADGRPSHNLFGIKAGSGWAGAVVEATTTEFVAGQPVKRVERFRAYGSYAEAFQDYARLLAQRYPSVLGSTEPRRFAAGLQQAGYASDPDYALKLERVINQFG